VTDGHADAAALGADTQLRKLEDLLGASNISLRSSEEKPLSSVPPL
jgi:hypothetical protein